jgi:hypothetical protein
MDAPGKSATTEHVHIEVAQTRAPDDQRQKPQ